ncbi:MAG: hypothetical protein RIF32_18140 [Leptospirales bacterium]|jgi:hypothetical protein
MTAPERNRIGIEFINGLSILILILTILSGFGACRQSPDRNPPAPEAVPSAEPEELCGECLELPKAEICTVAGSTLRNSCEAICRGQRILCNGACPCPEEEDS